MCQVRSIHCYSKLLICSCIIYFPAFIKVVLITWHKTFQDALAAMFNWSNSHVMHNQLNVNKELIFRVKEFLHQNFCVKFLKLSHRASSGESFQSFNEQFELTFHFILRNFFKITNWNVIHSFEPLRKFNESSFQRPCYRNFSVGLMLQKISCRPYVTENFCRTSVTETFR